MTVRDAIDLLSKLPEDQKELPLCYMDEVWIHEVTMVTYHEINEFGVSKDYPHMRVE